jgi:hypothetical protein
MLAFLLLFAFMIQYGYLFIIVTNILNTRLGQKSQITFTKVPSCASAYCLPITARS